MQRIYRTICDAGCMLLFVAALLFAYTYVGDMDEAEPQGRAQP